MLRFCVVYIVFDRSAPTSYGHDNWSMIVTVALADPLQGRLHRHLSLLEIPLHLGKEALIGGFLSSKFRCRHSPV